MRLISILTLALGASMAQAVTINAVYFGQTHVLKATDSYFGLVGNREALIKVHVTDPATPASPSVTATLSLSGQTQVLTLVGPATLPASIPDGLGVVQHSFSNTFTGYIPAAWVKKGLQVTVNAGTASTTITNIDIGAPTKVIMTMFDVQYFSDTNGNYPTNTFAELEAKWPVADLEVRRLGHVVFPELVIPPRTDVGTKAVRIKSKTEYEVQTGLPFDGEQAAALAWNGALKRAAGRSGRWSLYYLNVYNAYAGGQAGGFAGVGNGTDVGILNHELGHALSLPHWGDNASYPYKGDMHGIQAPTNYNETHAGPAWAFDLRTKAFIPPTVQANNVGGKPTGTYKVDPMQGGGEGWQEPAYLMNHFSDYSVNQMRDYLHGHVVVWNQALNSYASWNQTAGDYTTTVSNNGVQFPTTRDTQVISIMASISGSDPGVTMVYPPIGPYTSGLIRLFDPTVAADRTAAQSIFSPSNGSDLCVRVVQGGVTKTYMLAASWLTSQDPYSSGSLVTEAVNLPASGGEVTKIELLLTPNAEDNGLPANPQVLSTWAPLMPDPASFELAPVAYGSSAITMKATEGELAFGYSGTVEYLFTETTGNPGATSSGWQTSRSYTDIGLQPGTQYSYTVSMRAGTLAATASAPASAVTYTTAATNGVTVDSTQQFSLQTGSGLKGVTGLGTFDAGSADKLVVVISTEDANNAGTGYVYDVRYNGKVMNEAIQEDAGGNSGTAAIFYLDNPGAIGSGNIQVSAENPNGGIGCAYALSNTMPGFGASNSRTGTAANSVSLTTAGDRSAVIAVIDNAGKPNSSGTPTATSTSPSLLTQASSGSWGSQWGGHASGYRLVASPAAITPTFSTTTGTGYSINIAAVEFPAQPPLPNRWIQTAGGAQNWTTDSNWDDGNVPNPVSGTVLDFSTVNIAANTSLNLAANRTAKLWKFGDTSGSQRWTVGSGFTMTLAGASPGIQVNNGTTQVDSVVDGTAGLAKTGAGNLTLTAANTYTGATTITAGTLQIGNGGSTGSLPASSAITNDATMVFNRSNTITQGTEFASVIAGSGSLTKNGSGTLVLSGDNTYTGATTISAGTLQIGSGGTTGKLSTSSAITNNAALVFNRGNGVVQGTGFANTIGGTGSLTNAGVGTLTLNGANTYGGLTTVSAGSLKVLHADALGGTAAGTVVAGTTSGSTANARLELEGGINVAGEALTLNGAGNFYGALSSTSGSNTWAGNVTIGSAGTRLGATTGNSLTVGGVIDSGTVDTGLIIRTQDLTSTVILSGANIYLGDTNVLIGKLQLDGGNDRLPTGSKMTLGSGTNLAEFDLNGRNQELAGLALNSGATAANNSVNNSSATLATLTVNAASPSSFGGILKGNLALTKAGLETLTLSGLNTYTGITRVENGLLKLGANDVLPAGNALSLGSGATVGGLDLDNFNETLGGLTVTSDSASTNTLTIGAGRTLTVAGNLTVGFNSAANTTSKLTATGSGSLSVTGGTLQIGGSITSGVGSAATLDMSGLSNFTYTNSTGTFRVGDATNSSGVGTGSSTLILANTSTITAATFTMNSPTSAPHLVRLGSAANTINADTINIGVTSNRSGGTLNFNAPTGTLRIRNTAGDGRANMTVGYGSAPTAVVSTNTADLTGHSCDLLLGTLQVAGRTGSQAGSLTGSFSFDTGTLDATGITVGVRAGTSGNTGAVTGNLNFGGGTVIIGSSGIAVASNTSSLAANTVNGSVNISGGAVTIGATGGTSVTLGSSTSASNGGATAALNLTGGTLTLSGDISRGSTTGTVTSTLGLAGGTLDMGGNDIGAAGGGAITLNAESGTLRNVASINGTGGLTKTSSGTLTLAGTHTYTGTTTISAGTLAIDEGSIAASSNIVNDAALVYNLTTNARTLTNVISGSGSLTKNGSNKLTLSGSNTYTGNTVVNAGTLELAATGQLRFVLGASSESNNRLTGSGTANLKGSFIIDTSAADALSSGSWTLENVITLTGPYDPTFTVAGFTDAGSNRWTKANGTKLYTFDETTGVLTLGPATSYTSWISGFFPGETNPSIIGATADPDKDGIPSGVEMVIGGNPKLVMDLPLLPTIEMVTNPVSTPSIPPGNYLLFTYRRSDLSVDAGVTSGCETNTNLSASWIPATGAPGVVIQVDDNFTFTPPAAADTDRVRVYVPTGSDAARFGRLKVLVP